MQKMILMATCLLGASAMACTEIDHVEDIPAFIETPNVKPDEPGEDPGDDDSEPVLIFSEDFNGKINEKMWTHTEWNSPAWADFMGEITFPKLKKDRKIPMTDSTVVLQAVDPAIYGVTGKNYPFCMGLWTRNLYSFMYGDIRVRAKFKCGVGAWPAIWLMPADEAKVTWPRGGEIDIMERWNEDKDIAQSVHFARPNGNAVYISKAISEGTADLKLEEFNEYGMRKTPGKIEFLINGKVTQTVTQQDVEAKGGVWPYEDREYYIIINMACSPLASHWNVGAYRAPLPSLDLLPYEMAVDYVKVFAVE